MEICHALARVRVRARAAVPAANVLLTCQVAAEDPAPVRALAPLRDRAQERCQPAVAGRQRANCRISSIFLRLAATPAEADHRPDPSVLVTDWLVAHWQEARLPPS
jgi:hypothetical protein